jgi:LacI family transcriptional regulator
MRSPTIVDIAREAGVAFSTVARVFNGSGPVKQETRERIEEVVARLGYKPNVWARSLRSARSHLIAMLLMPTSEAGAEDPSLSGEENLAISSYYNRLQVSAMTECQGAGYRLFVEAFPSGTRSISKRLAAMAAKTQLDGVLLVPPLSDQLGVMKTLRKLEIPFVRVSPYTHLGMSSYVWIDDQRASYELTCHLLSLGHRDIAYIKGAPDHQSSEARFRGFCAAMEEAGIRVRPEFVVEHTYSMRFGSQAAERLLSARKCPTAIICFNDDVAAGAMTAAYRLGLALPKDLSIAGFDNSPIASALWPGLTSVYQPVGDLARTATKLLIREIETGESAPSQKLEHKLVLRGSTASSSK